MNSSQAQREGNEADPLDALLGAFSAGTLDPALHVLVESHLELNPRSRGFVAALEDLAADEMERSTPEPLADRERRLDDIFAHDPEPPTQEGGAADLPSALRRYLGCDLSEIRWKRVLPGVSEHKIERFGRGQATLLRVTGGRSLPSHTHEGGETTLVLTGAFSDGGKRYARGDVAVADSDLDHRPVVDEGQDCVCFVVTDGPLHLTGTIGRIVDLFRHG